ncbi:SH2 domain-containing adapter protein F isoform X6 [Falco cherrug]|nr:SH2 domain-containing adapter protein F isoform X6 [Falco cherrug]
MLLSGAAAGSERGGAGGGAGAGAGGAPQCVGTMARWLREHLGFRSAKPAPPAPPKPDYRAGPPPQPPPPPGGAAEPLAAAQPDIVAAYRLQKERDFEDPYSAAPPPATPDGPRYISPKHRLIKVEATEKVPASPPPLPPAASSSSPAGPELPEEPPQELAVLEDYADPFDAAQVAGSQAGLEKVAENDGYMEPYEAQKMMAEIRQKGLRDAPARPLHLYDTPYEPVLGGLDMDGDRLTCSRPRESRLPEDDERPPEEYDQPWEWKKERISKAFAGPSEGLGYGRTSPCREEKARATLRHGSSSLKSTKMLIAEPGPFVGERIDPALPLESQCWYHGAISRTDAETLLRLCKEASYLVRNSETSKNDFSLSLKSSQGFMHMKLSRTQENK